MGNGGNTWYINCFIVRNNVKLRIYFLNLFIDSSKHFYFNVFSAWRLKLYHQNESHKTTMKVNKSRPGAVFFLIKRVRRSLHSGTGGGRRVDNGVQGSVGNITSGSSSLKMSRRKKKKTKLRLYENLVKNFPNRIWSLFSNQSSKKYP